MIIPQEILRVCIFIKDPNLSNKLISKWETLIILMTQEKFRIELKTQLHRNQRRYSIKHRVRTKRNK